MGYGTWATAAQFYFAICRWNGPLLNRPRPVRVGGQSTNAPGRANQAETWGFFRIPAAGRIGTAAIILTVMVGYRAHSGAIGSGPERESNEAFGLAL